MTIMTENDLPIGSSGFQHGNPFICDKADCERLWSGRPNGEKFRCGFCGVRFKPGDIVRWQYTNDSHGASGNPFVCTTCDAPKETLVERRREMLLEYKRLKRIFD